VDLDLVLVVGHRVAVHAGHALEAVLLEATDDLGEQPARQLAGDLAAVAGPAGAPVGLERQVSDSLEVRGFTRYTICVVRSRVPAMEVLEAGD
jgi:hypothetical protein